MRLFQIYYNEETLASLDQGFIPLDNSKSERPDFYEYWPIRQALLSQNFLDDEYIGFFSPRLKEKTNLTFDQMAEKINHARSEVISFSPCFEEIACYPNSFIQGDAVHPGLLKTAQRIFNRLGIKINLATLIQDQTRTIYSNYFVATYRFWKEWLQLSEQIFEISENKNSILGRSLNSKVKHRTSSSYAMKVFIMERLVSILLELRNIDAEIGIDFNKIPTTWPEGDRLFFTLMDLDALKGHYIKTNLSVYQRFYEERRRQILRRLALETR
ncbi:hypothetical protein [Ottowia thiooxydans]|uniref:Uncharacterized protein n=1 Tax=Ottowia thiooxydans TaxID=219182 RepID=A0ABV2QEL3_9BURK